MISYMFDKIVFYINAFYDFLHNTNRLAVLVTTDHNN